MKPIRSCVAALLLAATAVAALAADRIRIERPLVDPATAETRQAVDALLEQAAAVSARLNGASIELFPAAQGRAVYTLSVTAVLKSDNPAVVVTMRRLADGAESAPWSWLGRISPELPTLLARAVFLQWKTFTGLTSAAATEPPVVTAELPAALVQQYAYPWALAARGRRHDRGGPGNLVRGDGPRLPHRGRTGQIARRRRDRELRHRARPHAGGRPS